MANVYTDLATDQLAAQSDYSQAPNQKLYGGTIRCLDVKKTSYTAATADPLYLVRLPKGARVFPHLSSIDHGDAGDACTGTVGYIYDDATGDADGICGSLALGGSAGNQQLSKATTGGAVLLTPVTLTADAWIYVTWGTVTNGVSHSQTWHIAYSLD